MDPVAGSASEREIGDQTTEGLEKVNGEDCTKAIKRLRKMLPRVKRDERKVESRLQRTSHGCVLILQECRLML